MGNARLDNGFSDLETPELDPGTNNATKLAIDFNGVDQGAKGQLDSDVGSEGALTAWVKVNDASRAETFRLKPDSSGYKNLPAAITIDGTTVQPAIRLEGEDADLTSWDDVVNSNSFAIVGSGSDPEFDELAPGLEDKRVKFNGGKLYRSGSAGVGDVGTDDFVVEFIYSNATETSYLINKISSGLSDSIVFYTISNTIKLYFDTGSFSALDLVLGSGLTPGAFYHVICFFDRSGNAKAFVNGAGSSTGDISPTSGDNIASGGLWAIGARGDTFSLPSNGSVPYFSLWHSSSWLSTADQAGVAAERFARCCGVYAQTAQVITSASNADGAIPETQFRSTEAYLEKWNIAETEAYLIPVGDDWIRADKVKDQAGTFRLGAKLEDDYTNLLLQSEDFSNASWTKTRTATGTAITGLGEQNFDAIVASADNDTHYVEQAATVTADNQSVSVYAKAGDIDGLKIENSSGTNQYAYFDLTSGTVGTTGAGLDSDNPAYIYPMGDGIYRCEIRYLSAGTTATVRFYATDGETDSWAGDAVTVSLYLFGAMLNDNISCLCSYIKTTTATATRASDTLYFYGYENLGEQDKLSVSVDTYGPIKTTIDARCGIYSVSDGTSSNGLYFYFDSTNCAQKYLVRLSGSTEISEESSGGYDLTSGIHAECMLAKDNFQAYESRVVLLESYSHDIPSSFSEIRLGASAGYAAGFSQVIENFTVSPYGLLFPRGIAQLDHDSGTDDTSAFIGYDDLTGDGTSFELRAGAGDTGLVTMNGGTLTPDTWYLISLEWSGGTAIDLKVDGVSVDTATADASLAGLQDLFLGWIALKDYTYKPDPGDPDYMITYGDVSIADVQIHNDLADGTDYTIGAWYTEMLSRGVPEYRPNLIHEIATEEYKISGASDNSKVDMIGDTLGTITNESGGSAAAGAQAPTTEVGISAGFWDDDLGIAEFGSGFQFLQETDHSYLGWIRINGTGDQVIWCNGAYNASDYQALIYDASEGELVYHANIGGTPRSVSATVDTDRLYHVAVTRDYDSGSGDTTMFFYLDGAQADGQVYSGAPVVTNDTMVMFAESEAAGVLTSPLIGRAVGNQFFDAALSLSTVDTYKDEGEAVILNGPYATQSITATTQTARITGATEANTGYPVLLGKETADSPWRAIGINDGSSGWQEFEKLQTLDSIRLYSKHFNEYGAHDCKFDDLDGGEDSPSTEIQPVEIASNKRKALEELILQRKPLHSWAIMVVRYT